MTSGELVLVLVLFLFAFLSRLILSKKSANNFDSDGHLYFLRTLQAQRAGPFGAIKLNVLDPVPYSLPFLWHWLLGHLPNKILSMLKGYLNPALEAAFSIAIFFFLIDQGYDHELGALGVVLYITTPLWFSSLNIGPRAESFTPRLSSELATNLFFLSQFYYAEFMFGVSLFLGALLSSFILGASKFSRQALLFLTPPTCMLTGSFIPVVSMLIGFFILLLCSKGKALGSFNDQVKHLLWYYKNNKDGLMTVSSRNNVKGLFSRRDGETKILFLSRFIFVVVQRNAFTGILIKAPILWVSFLILAQESGELFQDISFAPVFVACLLFFLTNLPRLLFLGTGERYISHAAVFVVLMAIECASLYEARQILWGVALYGFIFYLSEILLLPALDTRSKKIRAEAKKILEYAKQVDSKIVLLYPYHAAAGVYKFMAETNHRVLFPIGASGKVNRLLDSGLADGYPFVNLSKLSEIVEHFSVGLLVARKTDLVEKMGISWQPGGDWVEVDLALDEHRVFSRPAA